MVACGGAPTTAGPTPAPEPVEAPAPTATPTPSLTPTADVAAAVKAAYTPRQQPLTGTPGPAIVQAISWFFSVEEGLVPAPARFEIHRKTATGWQRFRVEDPDSDAFHKAVPYEGGILTAGARDAKLKLWTFADGAWSFDTLWERDWGGTHQRVREFEIGDVDGDGKDEIVAATHDMGVVAVLHPGQGANGGLQVEELHKTPGTFVHEIELGDIDGDGKLEFFATPSAPNRVEFSQAGMIVMYRFDGTSYATTIVENASATHVKEITVADLDHDGTDELYGVVEGRREAKDAILEPVRVNRYDETADGFRVQELFTLDDKGCRFLVHADFDHDGFDELVAAAEHGLWVADSVDGGMTWTPSLIDRDSGGFEHAAFPHDLDGDGEIELYVASDRQGEFRVYRYDRAAGTWSHERISDTPVDTYTWNMAAGVF
jgi:hypothetical protein